MKPTVAITLLPSIALLATYSAFAQGAFGLLPIDSCDEYVARAMSQVQMANLLRQGSYQASERTSRQPRSCGRCRIRLEGERAEVAGIEPPSVRALSLSFQAACLRLKLIGVAKKLGLIRAVH